MIRELQTWVAQAIRTLLPPLSTTNPELARYFGVVASGTGEWVSETTALNCSSVWAAVQCIAGDVASLPLVHYKLDEQGAKTPMVWSPLYRVLHDEFNPEMSAMDGRETMQARVLLWGNAYAEIVKNELGQVRALIPIASNRVQPFRPTPTSPLAYRVLVDPGPNVILPADRMFHLKGLGDGLLGDSVVGHARESIGMQLASERLGSETFANGALYSGYFQHPKSLGDNAVKHLRESIDADAARGKRGGYRILEEGMEFKQGSMPLKDAEFLETRKFQVTEIARWFGIPPHKIGDLERATFSNIENQQIDYVQSCLRRWLVRWEQECNRKLIAPLEYGNQKCKHLLNAILRGDVQTRFQAYAVGRNWGWLSADDIRELEDMNPLPDGQGTIYLVPTNMVPAARIDEIIDKQVAPDPAPVRVAPTPLDDLDPSERLLSLLLKDTALRAVTHEVDQVRKAAARHASDAVAWRTWVDEFYGRQTLYLAEVLHVSVDQARRYTHEHRARCLADGVGAAEAWNGAAVADLVALAAGTLKGDRHERVA